METVPRLYRKVRGRADYRRSLDLLAHVKQRAPDIVTKSGLMLGLGETIDELFEVLADLRAVGCDMLTLGQYLAPTLKHIPVARFVPPAEFDALAATGPLARLPAGGRRAVRALQLPRRRDGAGRRHELGTVPFARRHRRHRQVDPVPATRRMAERPRRPGTRLRRPRRHPARRPAPADPARLAQPTCPPGPRPCCSWPAGPNWWPRSFARRSKPARSWSPIDSSRRTWSTRATRAGLPPDELVDGRPVRDRRAAPGPDADPRPAGRGGCRPSGAGSRSHGKSRARVSGAGPATAFWPKRPRQPERVSGRRRHHPMWQPFNGNLRQLVVGTFLVQRGLLDQALCMTWDRIRGHDGIVRSFDAAWRKGRLGHAYLFVGPVGVGKHTLARELGRALLCENEHRSLKGVRPLPGCALVDAGTHPDLSLAARPEDKVELPIELIRELIEHLSLKPARGGRKVAIVDDADDLSAEAANAFLKTLEEPPPGSILILIGGPVPERQFSTILSRCQVVAFAPLANEAVVEFLAKAGITDEARLDRFVRVAGGSIGQALALDDETLWEFRKALLKAIDSETVDAFELSTRWNQYVEDAGKEAGVRRRRASLVVKLLIGMLQDGLRVLHGVPPTVADSSEAATWNGSPGGLDPTS